MTARTLLILAGVAGLAAPVRAEAPGRPDQAGSPPQAEAQRPAPAQSPEPVSADALAEAYFLYLQARTLDGQDDTVGAIAAMRKALAIVPASADLHAELAGFHASMGRAAEAAEAAETALRHDPAHRQGHRILAFVQAAVAEQMPAGPDATRMIDQAIHHFEQALAGDVEDPGAEITLGNLYLMRGNHAAAIETLEGFVASQPGYADGVLKLAQAYDAAGRTGDVVAQLEGLVQREPSDVRAGSWLAELYEQSDRWQDAARRWGILAAQGGPRVTLYRLRRATALANAGDAANARSLLVEITNDVPNEVSAWYLLSQVELRAGNAAAAEASARHIVEIDAADPRGPLALADVLSARGDHAGVVATLEPRVSAPPEDDLRRGVHGRLAVALAVAHQERGDAAAAVDVLEAARTRVPADDELLYSLGGAYQHAGRFDAAEATLRDLIARVPEHARALNYLGYMLADREQKLPEAVTLIERALRLEPGNPSFLDSLGWAYFKQGRLDDARSPLEQAAARMTTVSLVQEHLGDLYFQLKLYRQAATAYDRALAGDLADVDAGAVTRKRDRARELAGQ